MKVRFSSKQTLGLTWPPAMQVISHSDRSSRTMGFPEEDGTLGLRIASFPSSTLLGLCEYILGGGREVGWRSPNPDPIPSGYRFVIGLNNTGQPPVEGACE